MSRILVTGGCGYIGSHTLVDLSAQGYELISLDNLSNSHAFIMDRISELCGREIRNHCIDLCDKEDLRKVFAEYGDITGIVHFAAFKSVPESVEQPLKYYRNNLLSLMNLLELSEEFRIKYFVFSSSCSVYGDVQELPVTESSILNRAQSPYAYTKQAGERMVSDQHLTGSCSFMNLRYFNPVGAHESARIGELPMGPPLNLVPRITRTAIGKLEELTVYGTDYPTRDGSNIRDYIHVMDIARAHTLGLKYLESQAKEQHATVFNLGSGKGSTTLELIAAFENATGVSLKWKKGPRRSGDVVSIYANNDLAFQKLGWKPERDISEMMRTAWEWEKACLSL